MSYIRTLLVLLCIVAAPAAVNAQKLNKKQLLKERVEMQKTIDSLKAIIEGGALELSDTTQFEEELNSPSQFNYIDSEHFADVEPGSNPDSLLSMWYIQKRLTLNERDLDSVVLTSNIPDEVYIERLNKINSFIPLSYNNIVKNHIIYYTEKMPTKASHILGLSSYYLPMFEEVFDYYGLPKELKAMAIIESALNPTATSRVRARGMWQFMYRTALQYNLKINSYIDERLDPLASTHAAAKYLRDSYTIYGDWFLAISSYNCGVGNVNKAIRRAGSKDFWKIYPYLPTETRGYVPAFIAANYAMYYYCEHQIEPLRTAYPIATDTVMINRNLHFEQIADLCDIEKEAIRALNPQYKMDQIPGEVKPYALRLPQEKILTFIDLGDTIYDHRYDEFFKRRKEVEVGEQTVATTTTTPAVTPQKPKKSEPKNKPVYVTVRKGDTLGGIAKRNRTTVAKIKRLNGLKNNNIRVGRKLRVK